MSMLSGVVAAVASRRPVWFRHRPKLRRASVSAGVRRLANFWLVWSALLLVHETGHAVGAWHEGLTVTRITAGVGPVLWRGSAANTEVVLRLLPVAGLTTFGKTAANIAAGSSSGGWTSWAHELTTIAGGVLATLMFGAAVAAVVALRERGTGRRWRWGRYVVADALVLTLFNFLPVPPLDGGRAVLGAIVTWTGVHPTRDALFWMHVGGLALAIMPMTLWTRWTARIDSFALRCGAPKVSAD
jgi:membrane-associated protease RseP (regulator of RpoE activity)